MNYDELWPGGPCLIKDDHVFSLGTDAVMLASFASTAGVKSVCDLGCGSGIIALLIALKNERIHADGIELQPVSAQIARENAALNGLAERMNIIEGDLRAHRTMPGAGAYDLVVSNPPYFAVSSGKSADDIHAALSREERTCTLADVCKAAGYFSVLTF